jgi:hypothetical protein
MTKYHIRGALKRVFHVKRVIRHLYKAHGVFHVKRGSFSMLTICLLRFITGISTSI